MVQRVYDTLPSQVQDSLTNVAIVVQDEPTARQRSALTGRNRDLLGLYQGVPMIERGSGNMLIPDRITLFAGPLTRYTRNRYDLERQIRKTLLHEIGHHLGYDEAGVARLGLS
ncbi:MAG: metallopeptidase family protein [Thermomicrobiales bacterium]|nr:metallopeptidase family protein [Thermomicrobiales bacterium]